jgi:hypothetical protein
MRLIFSSEIRVFPGDFARNRLPVVLGLLSQSRMLFRVVSWRPCCVLKRRWAAVRDCNSANHDTNWTWFCGVDIVNELAESHQLAQARKRVSRAWKEKNNCQSFPFRWHKPDTYMTINFRDINYLFWIPFIRIFWTYVAKNYTWRGDNYIQILLDNKFRLDASRCHILVRLGVQFSALSICRTNTSEDLDLRHIWSDYSYYTLTSDVYIYIYIYIYLHRR